ncbi:MAG: DUF1080 domain-containing protein [Alistipes sp.]|nr:DUF1080 domain-containing protein [Alistipes sp.]
MKRIYLLAMLLVCAMCTPQAREKDGWVKLFNGRNLKGWHQLNGEAEFRVENGEIVGVSTMNTASSFLATDERYSDFILELEYKVEAGVNSGIQLRSQSKPEFKNGRVYGYQCEIDPAAYCGGIYDEMRSGWLYNLNNEPVAQKAFQLDSWNKLRVEAVGHSIRVWLNGIPTTDLIDDKDSEGFIALQVHEIGSDAKRAGKTIRWRNIRIKTENLESELSAPITEISQQNYVANYLSEREAKEGWKLLWNGKDLEGWKSNSGNANFQKGWKVEDGALVIKPKSGAGDIITSEKYHDFELQIDFKLTPGANSGIKYFIGLNGSVGCEYQILDNEKHPDAKAGRDGNRRLGSLYDIMPAEGWKHAKKYDWNRARIVVKGNHVEHWINGKKLIEYEKGGDAWREMISKSKFAGVKNFAGGDGGHILLQDHNDEVSYRNLKIREL